MIAILILLFFFEVVVVTVNSVEISVCYGFMPDKFFCLYRSSHEHFSACIGQFLYTLSQLWSEMKRLW